MSQPAGSCPQCGAKLQFRWSGAVQATCEFCQSIIVRTDLHLKKVGEVADLPPDASPIQINTEGVWDHKPFVVVGRILYEYQQGVWNEWHLLFNDGTSGWLSDAQLEWAISFQRPTPKPIHKNATILVGNKFTWEKVEYEVTSRTLAHYKGVEGQLPFQYWGKEDVYFVDLRTLSNAFATLDFSEDPALLFLGYFCEFEQLQLKNLRQFEGWY